MIKIIRLFEKSEEVYESIEDPKKDLSDSNMKLYDVDEYYRSIYNGG